MVQNPHRYRHLWVRGFTTTRKFKMYLIIHELYHHLFQNNENVTCTIFPLRPSIVKDTYHYLHLFSALLYYFSSYYMFVFHNALIQLVASYLYLEVMKTQKQVFIILDFIIYRFYYLRFYFYIAQNLIVHFVNNRFK